jgi:hypothetical protein
LSISEVGGEFGEREPSRLRGHDVNALTPRPQSVAKTCGSRRFTWQRSRQVSQKRASEN